MREIKFRGLTLSGEWVYGNLAVIHKDTRGGTKKGTYISNSAGIPFAYSVRPETVGQFTGERDELKQEIFEGDTIEYRLHEEGGNQVANFTGKVEFIDGSFYPMSLAHKSEDEFYNIEISYTKVIGNIHENPELLK